MTVYYVDNAGSNTSTYDTWAKAATALATITGIDGAGDTIYIASTHTEAPGTTTFAVGGTYAAPSKIYCVTTNAPPDTLAVTGVIGGTAAITINGVFYCYGVIWKMGVGSSSTLQINMASAVGDSQTYEECEFWTVTSSASVGVQILIGTGSSGTNNPHVIWRNCRVKFATTQASVALQSSTFRWNGGGFVSGSSAITTLLKGGGTGRNLDVIIEGVDLSGGASNMNLVDVTDVCGGRIIFRNCKLPASAVVRTGTIASSAVRIEMYNCDSADTNYRLYIDDYCGSIASNVAISYDSGVDDGSTQAFSWLMTSAANAEFPHLILRSPEIVKWNTTVGSAITVTVEFLINSATTLYKEDVYLEVQYLGTSGIPIASVDTDSKLALLSALTTTECDAGAGVANWTGDGAGAKSYKLVSTITPQEIGYIQVKVCLAKASTAIYVDPLLTVA